MWGSTARVGGGMALSHQLGGLHADGYADPAALLDAHADKQVIAVDIPLGLRCSGPRQADLLARKFVGGHRASSVFASPVRGILASTSQREASALHRSIDGRGFGAQAFGLLPKIRQWDTCLQADAYWRARVYEVHPEVSFAALNGGAGQGLWQSKKSEAGRERRLVLLAGFYGLEAVQTLLASVPRPLAAREVVLDALVALWSAARIAAGLATSLPSPPESDTAGLRMAIHF